MHALRPQPCVRRRCAGRRHPRPGGVAAAAASPPPPAASGGPPPPPPPPAALQWTPLHKPVVPLAASVSYNQFLEDVRRLAVKEVLLAHEGTYRALVVYKDGAVKYVQLPADDARVAGVLSTYGVSSSLAPAEPLPPDTPRLKLVKDLATFYVPAACIGVVYAVVQRMNLAKGDFEDREKLRKLADAERAAAKRVAAEEAEEDARAARGEGSNLSLEEGASFIQSSAKHIKATRGPKADAEQAGDDADAAAAAAPPPPGAPAPDGSPDAPVPSPPRRKPRNKSLTSNLKLRQDARIGFADVAGIGDAKIELMEVVDFFLKPEKYKRSGSKIPKGVLLVGPPGTGKTLLARAVAGEAGVDFFSITASEFVEMFVGVGAARVRSLFEQARASAPAIVFIDELDAVGRKRGGGGSGNDERDATLNQLLSELDGFSAAAAAKPIVVIAATNRPDILDSALVRPGRFDRRVTVTAPDLPGRAEVLAVHTRGKPLAADVDLRVVAGDTRGFTGAALANLVNLAALAAAQEGCELIAARHFESALETATLGKPAPGSSPRPGDVSRRLALHRVAAALALEVLPELAGVELLSISPREHSQNGFVRAAPDDARDAAGLATAAFLEQRAVAALCLRAAEREMYGEAGMSVGPSMGVAAAREALHAIVFSGSMSSSTLRWGRRSALAYRVGTSGTDFLGNATGYEVVPPHLAAHAYDEGIEEVTRRLAEADAAATRLMKAHWPGVVAAVDALVEKGTLSAAEFRKAAGLPAVRPQRALDVTHTHVGEPAAGGAGALPVAR